MKHTFAFIFGIVLLVAFIWLATTVSLQYNKSKENDEKLNVQSYCYQQSINYVMLFCSLSAQTKFADAKTQ